MNDTLGLQCVACGVRRKHKSLRYHPDTFQAYCENPYVCVELHPNSPINIISRQNQVRMLDFDEAQRLYSTNVVVEKSDKLKRLLNQPLTVRIHSVEMAEFLISESEKTHLNISELVRSFVQARMVDKPITKDSQEIYEQIDDDELVF